MKLRDGLAIGILALTSGSDSSEARGNRSAQIRAECDWVGGLVHDQVLQVRPFLDGDVLSYIEAGDAAENQCLKKHGLEPNVHAKRVYPHR